jgi:3'-phosphoadenosine 5'-phosphosulfate sulfotransferase (PAPS reductase)/FAD synthetase
MKDSPEVQALKTGNIPNNAKLLEAIHIQSIKEDKTHQYNYECDRLIGTCRKEIKDRIKEASAAPYTELAEIIAENNPLSLNVRTAQLTGVYQKNWDKKKKGMIPSDDNRSRFSQEKYKFFLDAPFDISNMCCKVMKKAPLHKYMKETGRFPMTAQMADESRLRTQQWINNGCNGFQMKSPISNPMSFWLENDVLQYIVENNLPICSVYGKVIKDTDCEEQMDITDFIPCEMTQRYKTTGRKRTGCMLCGFGCHLEKPGEGRFEQLRETHPKMYALLDVVKNNGVTFREAIQWTNEHGGTDIRL